MVGLEYDPQSNLRNKNGQQFVFDAGNRPRGVSSGEIYLYDGLGRRVQTIQASGDTRLWQYGHGGQLLFAWSGPGNQKTHEYIYLAGSLLATIDHHWPSNLIIATRYQHTDALGSPVALSDELGAVVERHVYEPWGAIVGKPAYSGIGYTGHVMDGGTGLTYMQQRYYDQSIGRFLSVDPVAARSAGDNFNRYWYANNNPYRFTDPDGRETGAGHATGQYAMPPPRINCSESCKKAANTVADWIPVIGDTKAIGDAYADPSAINILAAAVGILGPLGDSASKILKHGDNVLDSAGGLWTATKNSTPSENAFRHFQDHGNDFEAVNAVDYVRMAQDFLRNPPDGTLTKVRSNGDVVRYNPATNTFGVMDKTGTPRTFYKPDPAKHGHPTNLDYFNAQ